MSGWGRRWLRNVQLRRVDSVDWGWVRGGIRLGGGGRVLEFVRGGVDHT